MWKETWSHFLQFAKDDLPAEEREFCARWMFRGDQKVAEFGMLIGLAFYALTLIVLPLIANEHNSRQLFTVFLGFALAHATWLAVLRKTKASPRFFLWFLSSLLVAILAYFQRTGIFISTNFTADEIAISCSSNTAIVLYLILLMPYSRLSVVIPTATAYGGMIVWSMAHMGFTAKWASVVFLTVAFSVGLQIAKSLYRWQEARREFAALQKIASIEREQMHHTIGMAEHKVKESQARYEAMTRTTRMLAHDIRKPFSMVRALTRTLQTVKDPEKILRMVEMFDQESSRAIVSVDSMINDILAIGDHPELTPTDTAVESLIEVALSEAFRHRKEATTTFSYEWGHRTLLHIDALKITRALGNIVDNAVKAVANKGAIWFNTRDVTIEGKNFVELCIGNNGAPLPGDNPDRLFDAFYSADKQSTTLGLGLAIAQRFVDAHGGSIRASSLPEIGTRFWVTIPASTKHRGSPLRLPSTASEISQEWIELARNLEITTESESNHEAEDRIVKAHHLSPFRLLLIEDEQLYIDAVKAQVQHLIDAGSVILDEAKNASSAYDLCRQASYDLLLCDIDLGPLSESGFELVHGLRKTGITTYIAIHSNRITKADAKRAIQAGADIHLPKPIGRVQLTRLMASIAHDTLQAAG